MEQTDIEIRNILSNWSLHGISRIELVPTFWNSCVFIQTDEDDYFLKRRDHADESLRESRFIGLLESRGLPVSPPIPARDGAPFVEVDGTFFSLYRGLDGEAFGNLFGSDRVLQGHLLGESIALLHKNVGGILECVDMPRMDFPSQIVDQVAASVRRDEHGLPTEDVAAVAWQISTTLAQAHSGMIEEVIHRDPNPQNILFREFRLTGLIDFDMVTVGPRVFDPCYCSSSILTSAFQSREHLAVWPEIHRALFRGYQTVIPLNATERTVIPEIFIGIQLLFLAFSIDVNNFGAAAYNWRIIDWALSHRDEFAL